jgi:hypothetical protein
MCVCCVPVFGSYAQHHVSQELKRQAYLSPGVCVLVGPAGGCFSANTKVVIQESPVPVPIRDVELGQHLLCFDGGDDMLAPGAARWCELNNFVSLTHAQWCSRAQLACLAAL